MSLRIHIKYNKSKEMEGRKEEKREREGKAREVDWGRRVWTAMEPLPPVSHAEQVTSPPRSQLLHLCKR